MSQYSILALSSGIMVVLIRRGMTVGPAIAITIAVGVTILCGTINGSLVAFLRFNPIITTLGAMMVYQGIAYRLTEARALGVTGRFFSAVGSGRVLGIPVSVYIMLAVYLLVFIMLTYTGHGKRVYAVGGNGEASYISGINVRMVRFWGLVVSAATAGLAGTLIGVLILAVLQNGMVLLSVQAYYQLIVKGAVILLAVFVDSVRGGGFK